MAHQLAMDLPVERDEQRPRRMPLVGHVVVHGVVVLVRYREIGGFTMVRMRQDDDVPEIGTHLPRIERQLLVDYLNRVDLLSGDLIVI